VAQAADGIAVYWAASGATHPVDYFVQAVGQSTEAMLATTWSRFSLGADKGHPERISLLSLGMSQLGLPDLEVSTLRSAPHPRVDANQRFPGAWPLAVARSPGAIWTVVAHSGAGSSPWLSGGTTTPPYTATSPCRQIGIHCIT
jgi:hypothetical protein